MPSKSIAQQKFMGMVHGLKKGDIKPSDVSQDVKDAAKSMSKKDAKDYASTKHKGLPKKVKQRKGKNYSKNPNSYFWLKQFLFFVFSNNNKHYIFFLFFDVFY